MNDAWEFCSISSSPFFFLSLPLHSLLFSEMPQFLKTLQSSSSKTEGLRPVSPQQPRLSPAAKTHTGHWQAGSSQTPPAPPSNTSSLPSTPSPLVARRCLASEQPLQPTTTCAFPQGRGIWKFYGVIQSGQSSSENPGICVALLFPVFSEVLHCEYKLS